MLILKVLKKYEMRNRFTHIKHTYYQNKNNKKNYSQQVVLILCSASENKVLEHIKNSFVN